MNVTAPVSAIVASGSKLDNRRILAALIDLAVIGAGAAVVLAAAGVLGGDGALGAPLAAVVLCWGLYYYLACESGGGQTLGKKLMKLRVVRVDGRAASMPEIAVRTAVRLVDTALVGLIAMLATGERRARLGDLVAGTMVVAADPTVPPATPAAVAEPLPSEDEPRPATPDFAAPAASDPPASEPVAGEPVAAPEGEWTEEPAWAGEQPPDLTSPALKELAQDVASATGARSHEAEEAELEPVVEAEPVAEAESVDAAEPVAQMEPVVEAEAVVETEPVDAAQPVAEAEPVVEAQPVAAAESDEVTVRSVETVSAIDLIMGRDESSDGSQAGGERSPGSSRD